MQKVLLPEVAVIDTALRTGFANAILGHALASEADFRPATVSEKLPRIDLTARIALHCKTGLGPHDEEFRSLMMSRFAELCSLSGTTPFDVKNLEIELVAHRDGHFYRRHIDTQTGGNGGFAKSPRLLSCVLYLSREPQAFSGGDIRVFALLGEGERRISPRHNRLIAFSSIAPHEVTPISVPRDAFADARFSVNCWFHRVWE